MSDTSRERSEDFLKLAGQFKLGALVTEQSHPVTANVSSVARKDTAAALGLLFQADDDVVRKFREFAASGRAEQIAATVLKAVQGGGKIYFTGCGSTGRLSIMLDSIWRDFWQKKNEFNRINSVAEAEKNRVADLEGRTFSVMAGGDYALIKSVEGFEDFTKFGEKQINDLGVSAKDVVFAITEGGETSFVIGTAWAGVAAGAKVYFVYNNPDDILCEHVQRSREVIEDARIEKINLTTGPMAITGSTRMQATSIQLCVLTTILEMVARELTGVSAKNVAAEFLATLEEGYATLRSPGFLEQLAKLVALEEKVYRAGFQNNYHANHLGIDVLTDTTERSPTYCTPPFRKFDDANAADSWSYLFVPNDWTDTAWKNILKRKPRCVEWERDEVMSLVGEEKFERTSETIAKISSTELTRFKVGINGLRYRSQGVGDTAVAILSQQDDAEPLVKQLEKAVAGKSKAGLIYFGHQSSAANAAKIEQRVPGCVAVFVPLPEKNFLLDGVTRVLVKLVMNALSTCTMVRLGRVLGNYMVWVVPSNLKLIDRATRYITKLTGLDYEAANELLFEIIEYVEPRMKSDQAYPPVVGMAVVRTKENVSNPEAERRLKDNPLH
jgi:N-acetylmuramic acid 6-phosphate etherase